MGREFGIGREVGVAFDRLEGNPGGSVLLGPGDRTGGGVGAGVAAKETFAVT
jgi:hypothetical protein